MWQVSVATATSIRPAFGSEAEPQAQARRELMAEGDTDLPPGPGAAQTLSPFEVRSCNVGPTLWARSQGIQLPGLCYGVK